MSNNRARQSQPPSRVADQVRAGEVDDQTATHLWQRIGRDPDHGLRLVADELLLNSDQLKSVLRSRALREVKPGLIQTWRQHAFGALVIVAFLVLVLAVSLLRVGLPPPVGLGGVLAPQIVTRADRGLPALHVIQSDDVTTETRMSQPGAFGPDRDVIGRFTLSAVAPSSTLRMDQVSSTCGALQPGDIANEVTLDLPARVSSQTSLAPGACVSLIISPRTFAASAPSPLVLSDATLLEIHPSGNDVSIRVGVKLSAPQRQALAAVLAASDVFLLQQPSGVEQD